MQVLDERKPRRNLSPKLLTSLLVMTIHKSLTLIIKKHHSETSPNENTRRYFGINEYSQADFVGLLRQGLLEPFYQRIKNKL